MIKIQRKINFSVNKFEKDLNSSSCCKDRVKDLFNFVISIKLNDIFARGFTIDQRLQKTKIVSRGSSTSNPDNLISFYDAVFSAINNTCRDYVFVFNSELQMPSEQDIFLGMLTKDKVIAIKGEDFYQNLNQLLKFSFDKTDFYNYIKPYLENTIKMYDLLIERSIQSSKTILQKEDSTFLNRNDGTIDAFAAKDEAESKAYLENNHKSVLTVPTGTTVMFPQADVTSIEKSYIRAVDWMLAKFRIPATKFFGQSPTGFQSTGNLEITNYEQSLDEIFSFYMLPPLNQMSEAIRSNQTVSPVSFYKLRMLDGVNNVAATATLSGILDFCNSLVVAIAGVEQSTVIQNNNQMEQVEQLEEEL